MASRSNPLTPQTSGTRRGVSPKIPLHRQVYRTDSELTHSLGRNLFPSVVNSDSGHNDRDRSNESDGEDTAAEDENETEKQDNESEKSGNPTEINSDWVELAFESMKKECAELQLQLDIERRSAIVREPRYNFLEAHFKEYIRKREEYRRMINKMALRPNSSQTQERLESHSKETQTWKGIICSYCTKTFEIAHNKTFRDFVEWQTKSTFCVSRTTFQELQNRFKNVVEAIKEREVIYENRTERAQVITLKAETANLKAQVAQLMRKNKHGQNCLETLQRIIIKLVSDGSDPWVEKISENEQVWIDRILSKSRQLLCAADDKPPISVTPSTVDFSRPQMARSCTHSNGDHKEAAGDF